jgi:hypothetical protein
MNSWSYLALCLLIPQLWAVLASWGYRRWDRRKKSGAARDAPDYQI